MKLIIELSDLQTAPDDVQSWLLNAITGRQACAQKCSTKKEKVAVPVAPVESSPAKEVATSAPAEPAVAMDKLLSTAATVLESSGTEVLKTVLNRMGLSRVKECPPEKRAALLAELAVYAK